MRPDLDKYLAEFDSAVLTGVDADGYPFSVRCRPEPAGKQALRVTLPEDVSIRPGPAGLLCHSHDKRLLRLQSFVVRGRLEKAQGHWTFHPREFRPGLGLGGTVPMMRAVSAARRRAGRYLGSRGLARPRIRWDSLNAAKVRARHQSR